MRFGISSTVQKYRSRSYNSQSTIRLYQGARNLSLGGVGEMFGGVRDLDWGLVRRVIFKRIELSRAVVAERERIKK